MATQSSRKSSKTLPHDLPSPSSPRQLARGFLPHIQVRKAALVPGIYIPGACYDVCKRLPLFLLYIILFQLNLNFSRLSQFCFFFGRFFSYARRKPPKSWKICSYLPMLYLCIYVASVPCRTYGRGPLLRANQSVGANVVRSARVPLLHPRSYAR